MKKKFVRVMLFGALTLAVSTAVTSCKDYDDDIKNLQEQIDKVTSTSPVSTEDMKTAIEAAKKELQGKVTALEGLLNDKAAQSKLESEIARLEKAISDAQGTAAADLAKQLTDTKNELNTLINAKADASVVTEMNEQITKLDGMLTTLSTLIEAEKKYAASGDISGYKGTGFGAYINQSIKDAISDSDPDNLGAIASYVTTAIQSAISADAKALNDHIANLTGSSITSLETLLDKVYNDLYSENGEIKKKLDALDELLNAIDAYVGNDKQYADYAAIIKQIDDTRKQLATLNIPADKTFDAAVKDIITGELENVDGVLKALESKLQTEINALKGMIQSLVYVPEFSDGLVNFTALYANVSANITPDWASVVSTNEVKIKFRVSPASAVSELVKTDGKYTIMTDAQELKARAANIFSVTKVEAVEGESNLIEVTLNAGTAAKSYAVALTVAGNGTSEFTDITSNYFAAIMESRYIKNVTFESTDDATTLINSDAAAAIDFKVGKFKIEHYSDEGLTTDGKTQTIDDMQIPATPFAVKFAITDIQSKFTLTDGKLTVKTTGAAENLGKTCSVTPTVTVTSSKGTTKEYAGDAKTIMIIEALKEYGMAEGNKYEVKETWQSVGDQQLDLTAKVKNDIYALIGGGASDFSTVTGATPAEGSGVRFTVGDATDASTYKIVIPAGFKGTATPSVTLQVNSGVLSIKVTATVTVDHVAAEDIKLTTNPLSWDNGKAAFVVENDFASESKLQKVILKRDISQLYSGFDALEAAVAAKQCALAYTITPEGAATVDPSNVLTVADEYNGEEPIKVVLNVTGQDNAVLASYDIPFEMPTALNGVFEIPDAEARVITKEKADKATTADITGIAGFLWKDIRKEQMWPTITDASKFDDGMSSAEALTLYGLSVSYELASDATTQENKGFFNLGNLQKGQVQLSTTITTLPNIAKDLVLKVKVNASSKWGAVVNSGTEVTITYKKW